MSLPVSGSKVQCLSLFWVDDTALGAAEPRARLHGRSSQLEGFHLRNVHLVIVDNKSFDMGGRAIDKPFVSIPLGLRTRLPHFCVSFHEVCEYSSNSELLTLLLVALTEILLNQCKRQFLVVSQILPCLLAGARNFTTPSAPAGFWVRVDEKSPLPFIA